MTAEIKFDKVIGFFSFVGEKFEEKPIEVHVKVGDRAFRIGQKKNVFVHKFVTIGSLEERIDQMIEDKKKLAGAIVGADESWLTELDNDKFKQLIALNKSAIMD